MRVVCITLYRRPILTERLFASLAACYDIENTFLLLSCDWSAEHAAACDEVISLAESFDACATRVWVHKPERLGIDENKLFVIPQALAINGYPIILEDDTHPAPDALRYFDYCGERYRDDPRVVTVTGYNRVRTPAAQIDPYRLEWRHAFRPWGWAIHENRWESLFGSNAEAYRQYAGDRVNGLFDTFLHDHQGQGRGMVYPSLSRILLDGWEDAEHQWPRWYFDEHERNDHCFAGALEMDDPPASAWHES